MILLGNWSSRAWKNGAIAIVPENPGSPSTKFLAVAGTRRSVGNTAGEALDALTSQLSESEAGTLIVVQHARSDKFFNEAQQKRLQDLMSRWRSTRDTGAKCPDIEQQELEALVQTELQGAVQRARSLVQEVAP